MESVSVLYGVEIIDIAQFIQLVGDVSKEEVDDNDNINERVEDLLDLEFFRSSCKHHCGIFMCDHVSFFLGIELGGLGDTGGICYLDMPDGSFEKRYGGLSLKFKKVLSKSPRMYCVGY